MTDKLSTINHELSTINRLPTIDCRLPTSDDCRLPTSDDWRLSDRQLKIVAAIPCFNTEPFIADVVYKAKKYVDQVIVIDDGSHDGTAEAARVAGAQVINHGANRGYYHGSSHFLLLCSVNS